MEEMIIIMKTRHYMSLIKKLIELENIDGSNIYLDFNEVKDFEKFIDEKIKSLKKPVKYVFRSR